MNKTVEALNQAFESDPNAMHALVVNRVPCNIKLANDPYVQVEKSLVLEDSYSVGAMGLINAVLGANNLPLVAALFEDNPGGYPKFLGFTKYESNS